MTPIHRDTGKVLQQQWQDLEYWYIIRVRSRSLVLSDGSVILARMSWGDGERDAFKGEYSRYSPRGRSVNRVLPRRCRQLSRAVAARQDVAEWE